MRAGGEECCGAALGPVGSDALLNCNWGYVPQEIFICACGRVAMHYYVYSL